MKAGMVNMKITDRGHDYTMLGKTYSTEVKGGVLVSDALVDGEQVQRLVDMSVDSVVRTLAEKIGKDLAKDFRRMYIREVNQAVREYLTANKPKIIDRIVRASVKEAEQRFDDVYEDYD